MVDVAVDGADGVERDLDLFGLVTEGLPHVPLYLRKITPCRGFAGPRRRQVVGLAIFFFIQPKWYLSSSFTVFADGIRLPTTVRGLSYKLK